LYGAVRLKPSLKIAAARHHARLKKMNRPDDSCAILGSEPNWQADPVNFQAKTINYSELRALSDSGQKPKKICADVLLICPEAEEVILHRRGRKEENVEAHPGDLHIFGGGYIPPIGGGIASDRGGLRSTAAREVLEESQAAVSFDNLPPIDMMLTQEFGDPFNYVSLAFLGVPLSASSLPKLSGNWEGQIERVPFKTLSSVLTRNDWVPQGKALVLAWLALGAPNAKRNQKFGPHKPKALFDLIVDSQN
jgi:hypothetical protein